MTEWKRSPRIPTRLIRWINQVRAIASYWAQRTRRLHEGCLALSQARRRRGSVRLSLEGLEVRELLDANIAGSAATVLRNDEATSAVAPFSPAAAQPLVSPNSNPAGSSAASATITLHRTGTGASFQASVHGKIGVGIFTFTGAVTVVTGGDLGIVNDGDTVSGTISGISGDSIDGDDNFNMTDATSGYSFLNGGAIGSIDANSLGGAIGGTSGRPNAQGSDGREWGGFFHGTVGGGGSGGSSGLPLSSVPTPSCNCGCPGQEGSLLQPGPAQPSITKRNLPFNPETDSATVQTLPYDPNSGPSQVTLFPVRYADGVADIAATDLHSDGFGFDWGQTRTWSNGAGYATGSDNGNGWVDTYTPHLIQADGATNNTLIFIANGNTAYYYDLVNSVYQPRLSDGSQLTYNSSNDTFTLTDTSGDTIVLDGFGSSRLPAQRGQFASFTSPGGVTMAVTSYTSIGHIAEMQRSATSNGNTITESWLYSYVPSGDANAGLLSGVVLRTQVNAGAWNIVQQVQYTYYDGTQQYGGSAGDLMTATVEDGSGNTLSTSYYRYYTAGAANGYTHGLEYVFSPTSYDQLTAALGTNVSSLTDAQVASYADNYFQYDSSHRVTEEVAAGAGDSQTGGGLGTYTFSYTASSNPQGVNSWNTKTVVTNPDGSIDTIYTNYVGEVMLGDHYDPPSGPHTDEFFAYNGNGQVALVAAPSAISSYSDSYADLLNNVSGSYQYLNNSSGLITRYDYYATTTATETTAGGVTHYVEDEKIQQGQTGTLIPQETWQYYAHAYNGQTIAPIATDTVYRNDDGSGAETTTYTYTWYAGTALMQSETEYDPVISAAQNGPGTPDVTTIYFDTYGNTQWIRDPDGFIQYGAYDLATGAQTTEIDDVDTSKTTEFTNLPTGWSTPSNGGLNLETTDVVDALGRTIKETSPNGNITYYVYLDSEHEERIYQGWNGSAPTGPTEVIREDAADGYDEVLTMTAAPNLNPDGTPNGTEAISGLQSLTRDYFNDAGQVTAEYDYFNLDSLAYSTGIMGVVNVNYYQTQYGYDNAGRLVRTETPNGTIYRTVYNSLGEEMSDWVGTNDTPSSGEWSPSNNTGTANMVMVSSYQYDNGSVGDGNLTKQIVYPGGSPNQETDYWYDWRDRQVAEKEGVSSTENNGWPVPIFVTSYDNLGEAIETQQYAGNNVTPQIVNGVLQALSPSLLRAQESDSYDDQGRIYQTQVYDVNPNTGAVSSSALTTNDYYDLRGDLIAESDPGGLWTKSVYDGVGRDTMDYATDGAGGASWTAASSVANDTVLEQDQTIYDGDGNAIETKDSQRFDNINGPGPLAPASGGIGARVYYAAAYYDNADRLIESVDPGTNGGTAWTRPSTVPSSSSPTLLVTKYVYNAAGQVQDTIDPMGIHDRTYYDALGRTTETIQDYTDGTETAYSNIITHYGYDGDNHVIYVRADEPGGAYQQTDYLYGVSTAHASWVNSNDILGAIEYPDPSTGQPSAAQEAFYHVTALGQPTQFIDRNGTVHGYGYDTLGRLIWDEVGPFGAGVDNAMTGIGYNYNSQGNLAQVTSMGSNPSTVEYAYNGLGQLTGDYQAHNGGSITASTPEVQYAYNEMANDENNRRLASMTYPDGYTLNYNYNSGLDDHISRLSSISDASNTLEAYKYLGLATVVERDHPQTNVNQYVGLDQFGRIVSDNWYNTSTSQSTDDFQYGYDEDSNVLYKQNLVDAAMSELYQYNNLDELIYFARGTLNSSDNGIAGTPSATQSWVPDALGNFASVTTNGSTQTSTFNQQNEITSISGQGTVSYDADGNLTADGSGNTYVYDAWNELVAVKNSSGTTIAAYGYDGLGRRITVTENTTTTDLYYSSADQVLEEDVSGVAQERNVWSPVYVNAMILFDQSSQHNGVLAERLYVQQDANWNVTALVGTASTVAERYDYLPYGAVTVLNGDFSLRGVTEYGVPDLWQGMPYDWAVSVYLADNRVDSPALQRWLQVDPIGLNGGTNDYEIVGDGPIDAVDPTGLARLDWGDFVPGANVVNLFYEIGRFGREWRRGSELDAQRRSQQIAAEPLVGTPEWKMPGQPGNRPAFGGRLRTGGQTTQEAFGDAKRNIIQLGVTTAIVVGSVVIPGPEDVIMAGLASKYGLRALWQGGKRIWTRVIGKEVKCLTEIEAKALAREYAIASKSLPKSGKLETPHASDPVLQDAYRNLWRAQDERPGGTISELLREVASGGPLKHLDKAKGRLRQLIDRLNNRRLPPLSAADRAGAERVINDLKDAIRIAEGR